MQPWTIEVDPELCIGSGDCVGWAPDAFFLGPDDRTVRILVTATNSDLEAVKDAASSCPTGAITVVLAADTAS